VFGGGGGIDRSNIAAHCGVAVCHCAAAEVRVCAGQEDVDRDGSDVLSG